MGKKVERRVGKKVGRRVGKKVGRRVKVGRKVGKKVGRKVGKKVGRKVGRKSHTISTSCINHLLPPVTSSHHPQVAEVTGLQGHTEVGRLRHDLLNLNYPKLDDVIDKVTAANR